MKRSAAIVLAIILCVVITAGGAALMFFSPRGVLNPNSPEAAMESYINTNAYNWKEEFLKLYIASVTPFEEGDTVAEAVYTALSGNEPIRFREWKGVSTGNNPVYILSGASDFLTVQLAYENGSWNAVEFDVPGDLFTAETKTITVTVPSDAVVSVNGISLDHSFVQTENVPYEDMTALENRFENVPHRICYAVSGLYFYPTVDVTREGGTVLSACDGLNWSYMPPDAAAHSFSVQAPADAVVTVNGTELTAADSVGEIAYTPLVDIPEELSDKLPTLVHYAADGLYSMPNISAIDAEGNELTSSTGADGSLVFTAGNNEELYNTHHETVEAFIRNIAEYGSAHLEWISPASFVKKDTALFEYFAGARYSMIWIGTVRTTYDSITSYDYTALSDSAFLCKGRLVCTTKTYHQTVDLDLEYEMLWENTGSAWQVVDMAFTDNYSRTKDTE